MLRPVVVGAQNDGAAALSSPEFREAVAPLRELGREGPALYDVVYESQKR